MHKRLQCREIVSHGTSPKWLHKYCPEDAKYLRNGVVPICEKHAPGPSEMARNGTSLVDVTPADIDRLGQ